MSSQDMDTPLPAKLNRGIPPEQLAFFLKSLTLCINFILFASVELQLLSRNQMQEVRTDGHRKYSMPIMSCDWVVKIL